MGHHRAVGADYRLGEDALADDDCQRRHKFGPGGPACAQDRTGDATAHAIAHDLLAVPGQGIQDMADHHGMDSLVGQDALGGDAIRNRGDGDLFTGTADLEE